MVPWVWSPGCPAHTSWWWHSRESTGPWYSIALRSGWGQVCSSFHSPSNPFCRWASHFLTSSQLGFPWLARTAGKWQKMSQWALPPAPSVPLDRSHLPPQTCVSKWFSRTLTISPGSCGFILLSTRVFQLRELGIQRTNTRAIKDWGKEQIIWNRNNLNTSVLCSVMGEFSPDWVWAT